MVGSGGTGRALLPLAMLLAGAGCAGSGAGASGEGAAATAARTTPLTIESANGKHRFEVEIAATEAEQARGLMYRTDLTPDRGMLFTPYPAVGPGPREASFWMKNTPTSLDIVFIRADGTIARIAENTVPFSEAPVASGEPVAAVLEVIGGRMAALGVEEGDRVLWRGRLAR